MRKSFYFIVSVLFGVLFFLASCSETNEEDRFVNWQARNQHYLDSIVNLAQKNASGEWRIFKSYTLPPDNPNDINIGTDPLDYIYVKVLESGTGTMQVGYQDTVRVHYRGKLINDDVFDQSYKGALKPESAVPSKFGVSSLINGWTTVLQQMREGDRWEIFIPWSLAYGPGMMAGSSATILDYSVLHFDLQLVKVYPWDEYADKPIPDWK